MVPWGRTKELLDLEISYVLKAGLFGQWVPLPTIQHIIDMKSHSHEAKAVEQLDEEFMDETKID